MYTMSNTYYKQHLSKLKVLWKQQQIYCIMKRKLFQTCKRSGCHSVNHIHIQAYWTDEFCTCVIFAYAFVCPCLKNDIISTFLFHYWATMSECKNCSLTCKAMVRDVAWKCFSITSDTLCEVMNRSDTSSGWRSRNRSTTRRGQTKTSLGEACQGKYIWFENIIKNLYHLL